MVDLGVDTRGPNGRSSSSNSGSQMRCRSCRIGPTLANFCFGCRFDLPAGTARPDGRFNVAIIEYCTGVDMRRGSDADCRIIERAFCSVDCIELVGASVGSALGPNLVVGPGLAESVVRSVDPTSWHAGGCLG